MNRVRAVVLAALLAVGVATLFLIRPATGPAADEARLAWVATAEQLGVVGYRDPVGALSPDGTRVAYSEGARVRVVPVGGGTSLTLPPADGQVRHLAWLAGGRDALITDDTRAASRWWVLDLATASRVPLFGKRERVDAVDADTGSPASVRTNDLRNLAPSPDGQTIAATASGPKGAELWRIATDGTAADIRRIDGRVSAPAWTPAGEVVCIVTREGRARVTAPCGGSARALVPDVDVVGPLAFAPDGGTIYFASPNERGMVDLWAADWQTGRARRLSAFDRDTYAPSTSADGTVLFKLQSYRTAVAEIDLADGSVRQLAAFQSETPSYAPDGRTVAVTFGTWRRLLDDANYPDIAQHIGTITAGRGAEAAAEPLEVIASSVSEDQAMTWSPNGRWIAFHSHRELSDDVWVRPADGSGPDTRITFLGRGAEVGWPRWSPDGRTVLFDGASPSTGRSVMFTIGVSQETGEPTSDVQEVVVDGVSGDILHAEWLGGSDRLAAIAREGGGRHVIISVPAVGGPATIIRRVASDHDFPGLAASPDGREVAFIERAPDGYYQVYRLALTTGAVPIQVTTDPSHKTQPAWSPDGGRVAYTVWSYLAHFWMITP